MKKALFTIMVVAAMIVPSVTAAYVGYGVICYDPNNKVDWFSPIGPDTLIYTLDIYGQFAAGDTVIVTAPGDLSDACPILFRNNTIGYQIKGNTIAANRGFDFGQGTSFSVDGDCGGIFFNADRGPTGYMIMAVTDPDPFSGVWECITVVGHFRACPKLCYNCIVAERVMPCGDPEVWSGWGKIRPIYR